jgi:hypothetical protein
VILSGIATIIISLAFHGHLVRSDSLRQWSNVPGEDLLDQILKLICWGIERLLLLKQIKFDEQ